MNDERLTALPRKRRRVRNILAVYYSRGFTLSGRPGGLSSNPALVPGYVQ